ncbi:acyltransferase family protein [Streptomyces sp. 4N509B]|uniref:acyltransferase family protein n=1 Tax=Streptomyces sp. 4N509B TaxID=3457413 RepID=UPI003FD40A5C
MQRRDPRWDNLRFLAGTGVLLIHVTESFPVDEGGDGLHWLYLATWAMRIPLFALLAGYFSSATPLSRRGVRRLAEAVLVPYLAVLLLAWLEIRLMGAAGGAGLWDMGIHNAAWTLWFLLALFLWRLALPYLARLRYPVTTAVVVALVAGYLPIDPLPFAMSRAIAFLPFFLLGWRLREGTLLPALRARRRLTGGAAAVVLAATGGAAWLARERVDREWLTFRETYEELGVPLPVAFDWLVRCGVLLGGMAVALSLVRLFPRRRLPFVTYLGSGGLYIYLLHGFLLRPLNAAGVMDWARGGLAAQALLVVLCVAASAALASPPVRRLTMPIVQPRLLRLDRRLDRRLGRWLGQRSGQPSERRSDERPGRPSRPGRAAAPGRMSALGRRLADLRRPLTRPERPRRSPRPPHPPRPPRQRVRGRVRVPLGRGPGA